jgi:hypothetical protein
MTACEPITLLDAARLWYDAGYCVVPSHEDGGKRPFGPWKEYQTKRPTWEQIEAWLASGKYTGIGVITGQVSGNVEMIELEGPDKHSGQALNKITKVADTYADGELDKLWRTVLDGCIERSAGGGLHIFVRVDGQPVPGNTKLANNDAGKVLAETRGEGGFVIVAPTPGRSGHDKNTIYMFLSESSPLNTATISTDELECLHYIITEAIHSHTEPITPQSGTTTPPSKTTPQNGAQGLTPWDDYANRTTWAEILEPLGWTYAYTAPDGRKHWWRPGKGRGETASATTIEDGPMYVFSTSTVFRPNVGMSKQHVYAILHHGGDHVAAARSLVGEGYGERSDASLPSWIPDLDITPDEAEHADSDADATFNRDVMREVRQLLVREYARNQMNTLKLGQVAPIDAVPLGDFLSQPDDPVRYRVDELWPAEGRVLLAAAAKSGKTTMVAANLIPCLVDGGEFLGRFATDPITDGTAVLLNMEVGPNTLRRWMRDAGIVNTGNVVVANLRGKSSALALNSEEGRQRFATWLSDQRARVVVLDPLAPVLASLGLDENANADVAQFFAWWSQALTLAGVADDLIVHHTGHAGQRSRGASRLLDEPDAIWTLGKEADDDDGEFASLDPAPRHLSAYGRDVEMGAHLLEFDPLTKRLTLTDQPRSAIKGNMLERRIIKHMSDGKLRSQSAISDEVKGGKTPVWNAVNRLIESGALIDAGPTSRGKGRLLALDVTAS